MERTSFYFLKRLVSSALKCAAELEINMDIHLCTKLLSLFIKEPDYNIFLCGSSEEKAQDIALNHV